MDLTDRQLELKLCETYFSIMNKTKTLNISLEELCSVSKISYNNAVKVIPADFIENYFFLKILISKIDNEVLDELKTEIIDDDVSTARQRCPPGSGGRRVQRPPPGDRSPGAESDPLPGPTL